MEIVTRKWPRDTGSPCRWQ